MIPRRAGLAGAFLLLWVAACGPPPEPLQAEPEAQLVAVEFPDLSQVEARVREQIATQRREVEALAAVPETAPQRLGGAWGELGRLYHAYKFFEAADRCYTNAMALAPEDARWSYYRAHVYRQNGELERAVEALAQEAESRPDDLSAYLWLGELYKQLDRFEEARAALERSQEIEEDIALAHFLLGQLSAQEQDFTTAVEHYEAALALEPQASSIRYPFAQALQRMGETDRAREELQLRGERKPVMPDPLLRDLRDLATGVAVHLNLGSRAMRAGAFDKAREEFEAALALDPASAAAHLNLGAAFGQLGRYDEAVEVLEKALQLGLRRYQKSKAHFNIGALHQLRGRPEEAERQYREALRFDPGNRAATEQLAMIAARRAEPGGS